MRSIALVALALVVLVNCTDRLKDAAAKTAPSPTLSKPIGITTAGGVFSELVPAGHRLPYTYSETFGNATHGRDQVMVELAQKDSTGTETITSLRIPIPNAADKTLNVTVTLIISAEKSMRVKTTVSEPVSFGNMVRSQ